VVSNPPVTAAQQLNCARGRFEDPGRFLPLSRFFSRCRSLREDRGCSPESTLGCRVAGRNVLQPINLLPPAPSASIDFDSRRSITSCPV
jgi:hypothetical protein